MTRNKTTPCSPQDEPSQPVAGVIGAAFSGVSIMVANILKLFKVSFSQTEQQRLSLHFMFSFNKHFINYNLSLKRKKCNREYNTDTHIISDFKSSLKTDNSSIYLPIEYFPFRFPRSVTPPRPWNFLTSQDLNISLELFLLTISR